MGCRAHARLISAEKTLIQLVQGDCLDIMPTLAAGSVDMVLCDLPYGTTACKWDTPVNLGVLWTEYKRLVPLRAAIVLTGTQPFTSVLISFALDVFKYCWVWEKTRPGDIFNAKNKPLKSHEDICVFSKGTTANCSPARMNYFPQGVGEGGRVYKNCEEHEEYAFKGKRPSHGEYYVARGSGYPRSVIKVANPNKGSVHPTQKPIALMEYLVRTYTNPGDTVLDNCMGSGTTGVACVNTGRSFIGIEKDPGYFTIAQDRISAAQKGTS